LGLRRYGIVWTCHNHPVTGTSPARPSLFTNLCVDSYDRRCYNLRCPSGDFNVEVDNLIRRICLYGGAGSGKSTVSSKVFSHLKENGYNIEAVNEYVKKWVYEGKVPQEFDQVYIFAKQSHAEDVLLRKNKHVITDSPLLMVYSYSVLAKCDFADDLLSIALKFEKKYPGLHVFLDRYGIKYDPHGRYQNEEEALALDAHIEQIMKKHLKSYIKVRTVDREHVLKTIVDQLQ
jgi:thymidylate kinase